MRAIVVFKGYFKYESKKSFRQDFSRHLVEEGTDWDWVDKPKYGWEIDTVKVFSKPIPMTKRPGIKYCSDLEI